METNKYIFFCGHKPNQAGVHIFSQWFPAQFVEKTDDNVELEYENAEKYMMVQKTIIFNDMDTFGKMIRATDPSVLKQLGRQVQGFKQEVWDEHKFDIVVQGNRLKFGQNPQLMKRLLETGNKTIVEAANYDKVWGIGLNAEQAVKIPESQWPGQNLLGKALMVVREENRN